MCICCLPVFVYSFISPQLPSMARATLLHIRVIHHSLRFLSMSQSRNPSISYYVLHVSGFFILCPVRSPYVSVSVRKSTYQSACLSVSLSGLIFHHHSSSIPCIYVWIRRSLTRKNSICHRITCFDFAHIALYLHTDDTFALI